jgi:uncharacterized protein
VAGVMPERALAFECAGERLIGILSAPPSGAKVGVIVVVGGPQYRVGSHRQFVLLARRLASERIAVLRFDYRGMGDSSGPMQTFEDSVPDVAAAIDALKSACPAVERVVLWGLCDAASLSLLYWYATGDPRLAGMVLVNPWVRSDQSFARAQVKHYYRQRVLEREFWLKLTRGGVDVVGAVRAFAGAVMTAGARRGPEDNQAATFQERMALAMSRFARPILLVLSGQDLTASEFLEHAKANPAWRGVLERPHIDRHDFPAADHTFSGRASREALETLTMEWLERRIQTDFR